MRFYLSTTADIEYRCDRETGEEHFGYDGGITVPLAEKYDLGLELAEFCIAENLDRDYGKIQPVLEKKTERIRERILHAPYNELSPCSIDSRVLAVTELRYAQALEQAERWGARKMVVHSGFVPSLYFPEYFLQRSAEFWKRFLEEHPSDVVLCLENVMDRDPEMLARLAEQVDSERFGLCLDVGHANLTGITPERWLDVFGPRLTHLHIHNNRGAEPTRTAFSGDLHDPLGEGYMDMDRLLRQAADRDPELTVTVENDSRVTASVEWLREKGYIRETEE